jgi:hypothetical protein
MTRKKNTSEKINNKRNKPSAKVMRGRLFSLKDIRIVQRTVEKKYDEGRTRISQEVCRLLDWVQPSGWLKERACRDVLLKLEQEGLIKLPPRKITKKAHPSKKKLIDYSQRIDDTTVSSLDLASLRLVQVKGQKDEAFWNWMVRKYHYLGFNIFVGRSLKYIVYASDRVVGAIGWSDPAWSVAARDAMLEKIGCDNKSARKFGVNNGRFLILPWVAVPNLASKILSIAVKEVLAEWSNYYLVKPLYLETFVDPTNFYGTCYKASNWLQIGMSKGYKKTGQQHTNSQVPKLYFIYPVASNMRRRIIKMLEEAKNGSIVTCAD